MVNSLPYYYAVTVHIRQLSGKLRHIPNVFDIMELQDGITNFIARLSNRGDRLNNILKRGIPLTDAKRIFYEMDTP